MARVGGSFELRGGEATTVVLRHGMPVFKYEDLSGGDEDSLVGFRRVEVDRTPYDHVLTGPRGDWRIEVPGEALLGYSLAALLGWLQSATWEDLQFAIPWSVATRDGVVFAAGTHAALIGFDTWREDVGSGSTRGGGLALRRNVLIGLDASREDVGSGSTRGEGLALRHNVFVIDAEAFMRLLDELGTVERDGPWLLRMIARLGRFTLRDAQLPRLTDDNLAGFADREEIDRDEIQLVIDRWSDLTSFDVVVDAPRTITVAGTLGLVAVDDGPAPDLDDLADLALSAEVSVRTLDDDRDVVSWDTPTPWPAPDDENLPVDFQLEPARPVAVGATRSEVVVRVRGTAGEELYRSSFAADDPELAELSIIVPIDRRPPLAIDNGEGATDHPGRQLRGQVVRSRPGSVGGLTVLVQTRSEKNGALPRVFAAATTTDSGSFFTPFPSGEWESVSVLVSAAPGSLVELELDDDGRVVDDFVYLLLREDVEVGSEGSGDTARLPDHGELVRSGEYRQDLGGGCVNVTTPNRSLREYRYNAIVRTSDPDVANYTLRKDTSGGYFFEGGTSRWQRPRVDLDHPIQWQHAPEAGDNLSFYQAVTVATGHILWFKAMFKSDGYSLGDLVYSLPLAPGQKKQIVSYDMVNSLTASEAQRLQQGERLSATLFDDRTITDELSGGIDENLAGRSDASTAGVSAGLGVGGSIGAIGGSLGVSGGYANSRSRASQQGARNISQSFGEKLRQSLIQSSESYRQLNASVVTQVREGQEYSVTAEVVANHNHCHSLTMMYFEVLRHFAITQELAEVQECVFVPLLLTEFRPANIARWKDVLAPALRPVPSNTYSWPLRRLRHPLVGAFDANDRVRTNWTRVDYPENSYAEDPINQVTGSITMRVRLPRPRTRADRIMSLPVITETVVSREVDTVGTVASAILTGGLSLLDGPSTLTREQTVLARKDIGDRFLQLDANFQEVPPARAIRVTTFEPLSISFGGKTITLDFFGNETDRGQWQAYADLLGYSEAWRLLQAFFAGNLIAEWDAIFNRDIAPLLWDAIVESVAVEPIGAGSGLALDLTSTQRYQGGDRRMTLRARGGGHPPREDLATQMRVLATSADARALRSFATAIVQNVSLSYRTPHFAGPVFRGYAGDDLLDDSGVVLSTPLTSNDLRNPRVEDRYLQQELVDHLNANIEHYNGVLWRGLDENRRYMLLDGFAIDTYERDGRPAGRRSLASVVANELVTITGNALVFPVANGYHVNRSLLVERDAPEGDESRVSSLLARYQPLTPVEPYRLSVPTRGVYAEAVLGECDACEDVKENSSQDWTRFIVDEPTAIAPVTTPTPQRTDWRAIWAQFASPLVGMQQAREAPAPGAGLAGLSDALTEAGVFRDVTGLAGNQDNVVRTYLSNQENARAFAEMAKAMAIQEHNTSNSRSIMETIGEARSGGAITGEDHRQLVRDHLSQVVDGGQRQARDSHREAAREPSLENAGIEAVQRGREVRARTRSSDGSEQELEVGPADQPTQGGWTSITYEVPLVPQPNKTSCWAASMAMLESYRRGLDRQQSTVVSAASLAAEVGYSLEQSYDWDRLEDVREYLGLEDIDGLSLAQYPSATQWRDWLRTYGPLYVTIDGAPTHAIIVHGISGDGTNAGTTLQILDPWDTSASFDNDPTEFHPPNTGRSQVLTVDALNQRFNGGELDELELYSRWRILYSTAVQRHLRTGTPAPSGQASSSVTCWPVAAHDLVTQAAAVAVREYRTWSTGNLTETGTRGRDLVKEYWRGVTTFPGVSTPWSAVFISWLFARAYVDLAPAGTTVGGVDLTAYDAAGDATRTTIMRAANRCLRAQGLFHAASSHYSYVTTTRALVGTTSVVRDPATSQVQLGDMVLYGRLGNTYRVVGDDIERVVVRGFPSSHIDIVVGLEDFAAIPGVRVACLVGGNTLPSADRVARKYRPLVDGTDRIAGSGALPAAVQTAMTNGTLTRVGTTDYWQFPGAGTHERVQIADVEAIFRLAP